MKRDVTDSLEDDDVAVVDHGSAVTSTILLDELLAKLKPAQAKVIRLVKLNGFSIEDAADATGQSPALVKVNIHRGLGRLANVVQEQDGE